MAHSIKRGQGLAQRKRRQDEAHPSTSYGRPAKRSRKGPLKKAYKKGRLLGQGSFGSVYAGTRRFDRLPVAIKYVTKDENTVELGVDGQGLVPLEVALMQRVNAAPACPNIIQLLKWFDRPTQYTMILERHDPCQDLSTFCAENGRLDESLAKKVLVQLLSALKHCEGRGVLHRDVKPDNLLICTATHDIKLLDFGCGDLLKDSAYTQFAGSHAPPEWYHYRQYHAGPATVWSVGVTLYRLLCRSYPFRTGKVTVKTRLRFTRDLSLECRQLIRWCLSAEAEDRPSLQDIEQHPWLQSTE